MTVIMAVLSFVVIAYMVFATARQPRSLPRGWAAGSYIVVGVVSALMLLQELVTEGEEWSIGMRVLVILGVGNLSACAALALRALRRTSTTS